MLRRAEQCSGCTPGRVAALHSRPTAGHRAPNACAPYPQGVDWRRRETYAQGLCNGAVNPLPAGANSGVDVDPLEVVFIKVRCKAMCTVPIQPADSFAAMPAGPLIC